MMMLLLRVDDAAHSPMGCSGGEAHFRAAMHTSLPRCLTHSSKPCVHDSAWQPPNMIHAILICVHFIAEEPLCASCQEQGRDQRVSTVAFEKTKPREASAQMCAVSWSSAYSGMMDAAINAIAVERRSERRGPSPTRDPFPARRCPCPPRAPPPAGLVAAALFGA